MSDPTPPPDEPMPAQARARVRAELLAAAQANPPLRRWVIPAGVAAAVLLVAAMTAWAVQTRPDGSSGAPAGPTTSSAAPTLTPSPSTDLSPTLRESRSPETELAGPVDPDDPGDHWAGQGPCEQELRHPLPGAELAASFDDHTSMWVEGDRFALCDRRDRTTVQAPRPLDPVDQVDTYALSSIHTGPGEVTRVAGGVVPDGAMAFDVEYTFPDGQTVLAETVRAAGRTWWRVVHTYSSPGNEVEQPPIEVTVSYSGRQESYSLDWGIDTCAQVNHGC